jgi:hypothetical protein
MIADTLEDIRPNMIWQNLDEILSIIERIDEKNNYFNLTLPSKTTVLYPIFDQKILLSDEKEDDSSIDKKNFINTKNENNIKNKKEIKKEIEDDELDMELDNIINESIKERKNTKSVSTINSLKQQKQQNFNNFFDENKDVKFNLLTKKNKKI